MSQSISPPKSVYCLGIGGVGVGALAEYLIHRGWQVSGSDAVSNAITSRLKSMGAAIFTEHLVEHLDGVDEVIHSGAVSLNHPVLCAAKERNIPIFHRGKFLSKILSDSYSIVVSGTHGKTTTASIMSYFMRAQGLLVNDFIGGDLNQSVTQNTFVDTPYSVAEADESDGSFLFLHPKIAIITNLDADHLSAYENDFSNLQRSFKQFIAQVDDDGLIIICIDHPVLREMIPDIKQRLITYGFDDEADIKISHYVQNGLSSEFLVTTRAWQRLVALNLPGQHNALNALPSLAVAEYLGALDIDNLGALSIFPGVKRRLQRHASTELNNAEIMVFEDYGHHPEEIAVTIKALRQAWSDKRIVMVFQPHRYSRTSDLFEDFVAVLAQVDNLILLEVYDAGEALDVNATSEKLAAAVARDSLSDPLYVKDNQSLMAILQKNLRSNDVVVFQGAGCVGQHAKHLCEQSHFMTQ